MGTFAVTYDLTPDSPCLHKTNHDRCRELRISKHSYFWPTPLLLLLRKMKNMFRKNYILLANDYLAKMSFPVYTKKLRLSWQKLLPFVFASPFPQTTDLSQ